MGGIISVVFVGGCRPRAENLRYNTNDTARHTKNKLLEQVGGYA